MTYKEAYDKIIDAYFKNEIRPMQSEFCFCGTLCDGDAKWADRSNGEYSVRELREMENALLWPLYGIFTSRIQIEKDGEFIFMWSWCNRDVEEPKTQEYEDALFKGMCNALDVLRQIHFKRGELVGHPNTFEKRNLLA